MTHSLDAKRLADWKKTLANMGIRYKTDDEYKEAFHNLVGYFDVLIQMDLQQKQANKKDTPPQGIEAIN